MSIVPINPAWQLTKDVKLIGIHGHANTGKDSVAGYIQSSLVSPTAIHPFAHYLKWAASVAWGVPFLAFNDRHMKETIVDMWQMTPRQMVQYMGTEMFRAHNKDHWVLRLVGHINGELEQPLVDDIEDGDVIVIPDVRFQNECEFIQQNNGHIIHLTRPGVDGNVGFAGHASEAGIDWPALIRPAWSISNHGTLEELYLEVDKFLDANFPNQSTSDNY